MSEKHLPPLDLNGPASQVADRWRKWKRAFEYYAEGKGTDIDNVGNAPINVKPLGGRPGVGGGFELS